MLRQKSDALEAFQRFQVAAESECSLKIKTLSTDHGGEFNSNAFYDFCLQSGIKRQLSAPYSPQKNGVIERRNRIILNMVRSMLKEKRLPRVFWVEVVNTSVYLLNRSQAKILDDKLLMKLGLVSNLKLIT